MTYNMFNTSNVFDIIFDYLQISAKTCLNFEKNDFLSFVLFLNYY